jgi:hypothetical protein
MATVVSWNSSSYTVPAAGEENWAGATKVDGLLISLATNGFQKTGGTFTLSADADFGVTAGLKSLYYKSRSSNVATSGIIRFANAETGIGWRNAANSDNLLLTVDSSNRLTYNGVPIASSSGIVPPAAGGTGVANNAASTITISGAYALTLTLSNTTGVTLPTTGTLATLAGSETFTNKTVTSGIFATSARFSYATATTVPYFDANKDLVSSAVTPTELGYLTGVSSAIQTQINTKSPSASPTFTGTVTLPSGSVTASAWSYGSSTFGGSGVVTLSNTTASTSASTGALILSGSGAGLGVSGSGFFGGANLNLARSSSGANAATIHVQNTAAAALSNQATLSLGASSGATAGVTSTIVSEVTNAGNGAEKIFFTTWNGSAKGTRLTINADGTIDATTSLAIGTTPATAGELRLPNNGNGIAFRNAANSANVTLGVDSSNNWRFYAGSVVADTGAFAQSSSTNANILAGRLNLGVSTTWTTTNTQLQVYRSATESATHVGIDIFTERTGDAAYTTGEYAGLMSTMRRTASNPGGTITETNSSGHSNIVCEARINVGAGTNYTDAQTVGWNNIRIKGIVLSSVSTLAITNYCKILIDTDTQATGTNKYGLYIGALSGATNNFAINTEGGTVQFKGGSVVCSGAALSTSATDGFLYIPTCAGTPSGVPTSKTGTVAMVFDTTNNKLYIYDGSWLGGTAPGAFT